MTERTVETLYREPPPTPDPRPRPMVAPDLSWDIVQHQVDGPGSTDRACVDERLRQEIWQRAMSDLADIAYRDQHDGKTGQTLVLYRPAVGQTPSFIDPRFEKSMLYHLNLIQDDEGKALVDRVVQELVRVAQTDPFSGHWGHLQPGEPGLVVTVGERQKLKGFPPR